MSLANGLIIAAPRSGSGKTLVTLGLLAALQRRGLKVAPAKTGPDYIDAAIHARVAGRSTVNLDPWAMSPARLRELANRQAADADLLLIEGVMGLFDGAVDGSGSTGDLAAMLGLPVILVVDAERQAQSIAPLIAGFAHWRGDVSVVGVIVNRVATTRHETMLRNAVAQTGLPLLGTLPRRAEMVLPERHLGLVLPDEAAGFDAAVDAAAQVVADYVDLNHLLAFSGVIAAEDEAQPLPSPLVGEGARRAGEGGVPLALPNEHPPHPVLRTTFSHEGRRKEELAPLGQRIAIARDDAFAFLYPHLLDGWRRQGAELSFFSPLADEAPDAGADAIFLPGGYPELHGATLASAETFKSGLLAAQARDALIYGECGGFMVLGESLTDKTGAGFAMAGLLPVQTRIDRPKRTLGYRRLAHASPLPWPVRLNGHEFHYSSARQLRSEPLFTATDAAGEAMPPMGTVLGRVMGSYAHVIDLA